MKRTPCAWRSVSCWRRFAAQTTCAPVPAPSTARSGTSLRTWAGRSARKGRPPCGHRSGGGRMRAARSGTARRPSGQRRAGGGRRTCRAPRRAVPCAAACPRHGRRAGTAPDRGRRRAGRSSWPGRGGSARRRGASRRIPGIPSGRTRAETCHNGSMCPGRVVLRAAGADVRARGRRCWAWRPRRRGCGRKVEAGAASPAPLSSATCRAARSRPRWSR